MFVIRWLAIFIYLLKLKGIIEDYHYRSELDILNGFWSYSAWEDGLDCYKKESVDGE